MEHPHPDPLLSGFFWILPHLILRSTLFQLEDDHLYCPLLKVALSSLLLLRGSCLIMALYHTVQYFHLQTQKFNLHDASRQPSSRAVAQQ